MSLPAPKFAVYYGTIRLDNGQVVTYTAAQIAALYNISDQSYLAVPLVGVSPFYGGMDELSYYHLKPNPSGIYDDAKERYNVFNDIQYQPDFFTHAGKWVKPKIIDEEPDL